MFNHSNTLKKILKEKEKYLFPCIEDIIKNGLIQERFSEDEYLPSRQDVTRYLAKWFKYIEIPSEICRDWMIPYVIDILSSISSSSPSQIRHSTKSNIRYIYNSNLSFDCGCEENILKADCESTCPLYLKMLDNHKKRKEKEADRSYIVEIEDGRIYDEEDKKNEIKNKYMEQFEKSWEKACQLLKKGIPKKEVVIILNDQGFKTRTGKKWTYPTLVVELKKSEIRNQNCNN